MDKIDKALNNLSPEEKLEIKLVFIKLKSGNLRELNVKKLKRRDNIFRVRKENLRVIYRAEDREISILAVGRRHENTYKSF